MAEFSIQIAGKTAAVSSLFESTRDYCRRYLTREAPEVTITVTREDLAFEQEALLREAREEGIRARVFPAPFLERAAVQRKLAEYLFDFDILMLHGSTVAVDGKAYLFAARCGTGKSTHTRLWREVFGARAVMVNDDKPFLRLAGSSVLACGSPWSGKHGLDANITVPLKGICILGRGAENRIWPIPPEEALPMLRHQGYQPLEPRKYRRYLELTDMLARNVPLWQMECSKHPEAAEMAYAAMSTDL